MELRPHDEEVKVERLLRATRPAPDEQYAERLERRLLGRRPRAAANGRLRTALVAFGAVAAVALAALTLALAGAGPFGGGGQDVRAKDDCRLVEVTEIVRKPVVRETADGGTTIDYVRQERTRLVKRCR